MDGMMFSPRLAGSASGRAQRMMGDPSVQGDGEPLVGSVDAGSGTNPGRSSIGGAAVVAVRSPSPAVHRRCSSPLKPLQQSHVVVRAMPALPSGRHRLVHLPPGSFPSGVATGTYQQAQQQRAQQQVQGQAPSPPPAGTGPPPVPPPAPGSLVGQEGEIQASPRSGAGASQRVVAAESAEDSAGRRTPPPLRLAMLGERLQASMEQPGPGEEPRQQRAALRDVQLQALVAGLQDSVEASLARGMQEAEGRLQDQFAEMCAQSSRGAAAESTESAGIKELREMLEAERQDRSDLAEKQSEVLHSMIQELTAVKSAAESRSWELVQLRAEVQVLRASDTARGARLQDVVEAFGEGLHGECEARNRGDEEMRSAISALQAPSGEQGIPASIAEELRALGRRVDASEAQLQQLAEVTVRQACDTAAGAVTCCQEFATQLESEVARVGAELASGLGATHETACAEVARLRAELESIQRQLESGAELGEAIQRQRAAANCALAEGLASLRGASCSDSSAGSAADAKGGDLEALLLRAEAQETEHATGLQELSELFLGELAGLRASTDEQCRLLLEELHGEQDARIREFAEFREALSVLTA